MVKFIRKLHNSKKGATMVEYGLVAALVSIAGVAALTNVGGGVSRAFTSVNAKLPAPPAS
ncbi:MAG: Flp family type IVb pilin [Chakrabartia sp.]